MIYFIAESVLFFLVFYFLVPGIFLTAALTHSHPHGRRERGARQPG